MNATDDDNAFAPLGPTLNDFKHFSYFCLFSLAWKNQYLRFEGGGRIVEEGKRGQKIWW